MQLGILPILGIIFVTLKLLDVITWSWLWVTAPFWGAFVLWIIIFGLAAWFINKYFNHECK